MNDGLINEFENLSLRVKDVEKDLESKLNTSKTRILDALKELQDLKTRNVETLTRELFFNETCDVLPYFKTHKQDPSITCAEHCDMKTVHTAFATYRVYIYCCQKHQYELEKNPRIQILETLMVPDLGGRLRAGFCNEVKHKQ